MKLGNKNVPGHYMALGICVMAAVTFLTYMNALGNGFVYDDHAFLVDNPWIKDIRHIGEIFTKHSTGFSAEPYAAISYRPMLYMAYMAEYALFGPRPFAFHLVSILMHILNGVVFFLLSLRLLRAGRDGRGEAFATGYLPSIFASLLFTTHPLNSETVAWISTMPELSYTFLSLSLFYIYAWALEREEGGTSGPAPLPSFRYYAAAAVIYLVAMLFKETAIFMAALVAVYDYLFSRDERLISLPRIKRLLPFGASAVIYIAVRLSVLKGMAPAVKLHSYLSAYEYILNAIALSGKEIRTLVIPLNAYPLQLLDPVFSALEPRVLVPLALFVVAAFLIAVFRKRMHPLYILSLSFMALPVLPSLYSVAISRHPYADRYLYFPSIGYALFLSLIYRGVAGSSFAKRFRAALYAVTAVFAVMVLIFSLWASERNRFWKDDLTLRSRVLEGSPENYVALHDIGALYLRMDRPEEGIRMLEKARTLNAMSSHPDLSMLLMTRRVLADEYAKRGMVEDAIREYNEAMKLEPESIVSLYNLAMLYKEKGYFDEATGLYRKALPLAKEPWQFRDIYSNLGDSYAAKGMWTEALQNYEDALKMDPADVKLIEKADMARAKAQRPLKPRRSLNGRERQDPQ